MASILVIDDEPELRDIFSSILRRAGHEVLLAAGAREGLAAFYRYCPDVVITDVILPDESGLNLILELTRHQTAAVIVVSGNENVGGGDLLNFATLFGACRALRKPVLRADLIATVDDVLGHRSSRDDSGDGANGFRQFA